MLNRKDISELRKIKDTIDTWSDIDRINKLAGVETRVSGRVIEHFKVERIKALHKPRKR